MGTSAILGFGQTGQAVAAYLTAQGRAYTVYEREERLAYFSKRYPHLTFRQFGTPMREKTLYRSPGIRPDHVAILRAVAGGATLTSEIETFCRLCPAPIYGVTGSDGKTTTATLAARLLEARGHTVWLGGNVGRPLLPLLDQIRPHHRVVLELSSFQLMTFSCAVHAGAVTNLTDNHLDWHTDREEYRAAKRNLLLCACRRVQNARYLLAPELGGVTVSAYTENANYSLQNGALFHGEERLCRAEDMPIRGTHNLENLLTAVALTRTGSAEVAYVLPRFRGVEHRMSFVGTFRGVDCYDSSIDTTPARTAVTLSTVRKPCTVLCGGRPKGVPNAPLTDALLQWATHAVFVGESGEEMREDLLTDPRYAGSPTTEYYPDFTRAVRRALAATPAGGMLVLSPAATSFDAFSSYRERGKRFCEILESEVPEGTEK